MKKVVFIELKISLERLCSGVKYLTEEMVDELILRCKKLEASQVDASDAHDDTFKQAPSKDPYNPLFLALTEVFSSMESLNRWDPKFVAGHHHI